MTVYAIRHKETGAIRMIDAPNHAAALRHVSTDVFAVTRPSQRETAHLIKQGVELEDYVPARGGEDGGAVDPAPSQAGSKPDDHD